MSIEENHVLERLTRLETHFEARFEARFDELLRRFDELLRRFDEQATLHADHEIRLRALERAPEITPEVEIRLKHLKDRPVGITVAGLWVPQ